MKKGFWIILALSAHVFTACNTNSNDRSDNVYILDYSINKDLLLELGIFANDVEPASLSEEELLECEAILETLIEGKFNKNAQEKIDLAGYGKQYIATKDGLGRKIVFINCFCRPETFENRRQKLILTSDGGQCFFNLKIDLAAKKVIEFGMNGLV